MAVQNSTLTEEQRARMLRQESTGLPRVLTGARDALVGTLARPGTAVQDTLRVGATQLLGGDPSTLVGGQDRYNQAAQGLVSRGLSDISAGVNDIVAPIQQAGLAALGAKPRQPGSDATSTPPIVQPQPAPMATTPQTSGGVGARTAADLEGINAGIAYNLAAAQPAPARDAQRGDYNQMNTPSPRQPENIVEGGYGGFGGGGAREYLDRMAAQDAQTQARTDQRRREAQEGVERIGLSNTAARGSIQESMVARRQLAAMDQAGLQRIQDQGAAQRQAMQGETDLQRANVVGQFGLQQEAMRAAAGIEQAELTGQYGLAGREAAAQAAIAQTQAQSQSGSNLRAQAEAMRLARQQAIADEAEQAGDFATRDRALGISQPTAARLTQDALGNVVAVDGRPVTAQEAQAYLQAIGYYKTPAQ
ncbi:hypothetical protein [Pseudomonas phage Rollin]|nr:hypothetical protein [Pseudomonas phage Rollin]